MSVTNILGNTLGKKIEENFSERKNREEFKRHVAKFIDKNNKQLNHNTPSYRLVFAADGRDMDFIYDILGIDQQYITATMKTLKNVDPSWRVVNKPNYITLLLLVKYFDKVKDKASKEYALMYLTLAIYSSLHFKYYRFEPNDNIMQYTINRLNQRYYFKQYGTVFKAIYAVSSQNDETNAINLRKNSDDEVIKYLISVFSRLNNQMRTFSQEFYKDQSSKNYLNSVSDNTSEEDYFETTNISFAIAKATEATTGAFSRSAINYRLCNTSSRVSKISPSVIREVMIDIKSNEIEKVSELINNIVTLYLSDTKNEADSIGSRKFISYCNELYTKSNTKDKAILDIKDTLDYFLSEYSNKYNKTERAATKNNYRKAIYMYFVLLIADRS